MTTLFLLCALIGGTVFIFQFVMAIIGMGGDEFDFDGGDIDVPDDFDLDVSDAQGDMVDHGSTWFFGVISFRTVVAAVTFFGLVGMAGMSTKGTSAEMSPFIVFILAVGGGAVAMYGVHWLMRLLHSLKHEGNVRVGRTVGAAGNVYVPIPAEKSGVGKIQIRTQNRIMEYDAMTATAHKLPTGARVVVVGVINPSTLEVEPVDESKVKSA